jgi:hypothetical protein
VWIEKQVYWDRQIWTWCKRLEFSPRDLWFQSYGRDCLIGTWKRVRYSSTISETVGAQVGLRKQVLKWRNNVTYFPCICLCEEWLMVCLKLISTGQGRNADIVTIKNVRSANPNRCTVLFCVIAYPQQSVGCFAYWNQHSRPSNSSTEGKDRKWGHNNIGEGI